MSRAITLLVGSSARAEAVGKGLQKLLQGSAISLEHGAQRSGVPAVAAFVDKADMVSTLKGAGAMAAVYSSQPGASVYPNDLFRKADVTAVVNAIRTTTEGASEATRDTCLRAALRIAGDKAAGLSVVSGFGASEDWVSPMAEHLKEAEPQFKAVAISNVALPKAVNQTVMFPETGPTVFLATRGTAPSGVPTELANVGGVRTTIAQLVQGLAGGAPLAPVAYHNSDGPVIFSGSSELAIFLAAADALKSIGADKEAAAIVAAVQKAVNAQSVTSLAWEGEAAGATALAKATA